MTLEAAAGDAEALGSAVVSAEAAGCPQTELEVAKAELKALRRRDCLAVVLRGATGSTASFINGNYSPTKEKANGQTVFMKVGDRTKCLYRGTDRGWWATDIEGKDANDISGFATTLVAGLAHPTLAKGWMVGDDTAWAQQPVEASVMVSSCFNSLVPF